MDILDIDEALKDDSFIFLEDKTHDDISNILQQWKSNSCLPPSTTHSQQQQPQPEPAYRYDSRTFTRPKRKLTQNLETQPVCSSTSSPLNQQVHQQNGSPALNMEIGGLVTTMHKSFLQDTSPPPSICSSMEMSTDRMNNSLITSADFSNVNFLQSTNSLDFNAPNTRVGEKVFSLTDKTTSDGYTLSDMIRDRKALESLTSSGDGTLIKDSHIAQIDDISLALSKTASSCSTMDNSTESVEGNNRTVEIMNKDRTAHGVQLCAARAERGNNIESMFQRTMVLSDKMSGDTTFNLGANTKGQTLNVTHNLENSKKLLEDELTKPAPVLDETVCISGVRNGDSTFDCQQNVTPDVRCETPEGVGKPAPAMQFFESTPQTTNARRNKQHYTPSLKIAGDVNISPIVGSQLNTETNSTCLLNRTFEQDQHNKSNCNANVLSESLSNLGVMEMIENIENPNETFCRNYTHLDQQSQAGIEMQNVMDLAKAEAQLLASNDNEEEFDHLLNELGRLELNAEQLKMRKSLDSIKKRFNYGSNRNKSHKETSRGVKDIKETVPSSAALVGEIEHSPREHLNLTIDLVNNEESKKSKESAVPELTCESVEMKGYHQKDSSNSSDSKSSALSSNGLNSSSISSASNTGERLLSRRSRMYDDINLSTLSTSSPNTPKSASASFTMQKEENIVEERSAVGVEAGANVVSAQKDEVLIEEKTEAAEQREIASRGQETDVTMYKLAEKRERDRDRFKTIKINKNRSRGEGSVPGTELNVPCIDDYEENNVVELEAKAEDESQVKRYSRLDDHRTSLFSSNKIAVENLGSTGLSTNINTNYLTYKKSNGKQTHATNVSEVAPVIAATEETTTANVIPKSRVEPRSLSRPRFISGLHKFNVVSKATSADDLEKSSSTSKPLNAIVNVTAVKNNVKNVSVGGSISKIQPVDDNYKSGGGDLKSPMGIKSKSFHNLSSNFGFSTAPATGSGLPAPKTHAFGLKKPTNVEKQTKFVSCRNTTNNSSNQQSSVQEKCDDSVFKVPKLVSGIRAPGTATVASGKRGSLLRPSSGYFSSNVMAKGVSATSNEVDPDAGRHSPTDSTSSASSRGSAQSSGKDIKSQSNVSVNKPSLSATLTKVTISSSGIPKPSGLRPPSNIKRSALPRPSSYIKIEK